MTPLIIHGGTPAAPAQASGAIVRPPVFLPEDVAVSDVGENVEFRIGNSVLTFRYADALRISQMIRVHAKRAKRRAGDVSRHWSAIAMLDDASERK